MNTSNGYNVSSRSRWRRGRVVNIAMLKVLQYYTCRPTGNTFESTIFTAYKIACKSACMANRPEMFWPTRGADPCCHGNDIWARRGVQSPTGLYRSHLMTDDWSLLLSTVFSDLPAPTRFILPFVSFCLINVLTVIFCSFSIVYKLFDLTAAYAGP